MENLQKQREKMEAHKEALVKKVMNVLKGETATDVREIMRMSEEAIYQQMQKTVVK